VTGVLSLVRQKGSRLLSCHTFPPDATSLQQSEKNWPLDISQVATPDFLFVPEVLQHSVCLGVWNSGKYSRLHVARGLVLLLSIAILACVFASLTICDACCADGALTIALANQVSG